MTLQFDLYYSMRSPYSYLLTPRLSAFVADHDVRCNVRPVYPLAVRVPGFFERAQPGFASYLRIDTARLAERHGIPFGRPDPDPIVQNMETREIDGEQPYIQRLTRLAVAAAEQGPGLAFITEVSRLIFGGTVQGWDRGSHLAEAVSRAGLDLAALDAAIEADPGHYDGLIEGHEAAQREIGHWGTPLMIIDGEPFFGQDRLDDLIWRLNKLGLQRRSA